MQVVYIQTCRKDTHKTKANDYLKDKKAAWRKMSTSLLRSRCLVPAIRVTLLLTLWNTQQERYSPKTVHKLQISFQSSYLNRTVNNQNKTRLHFLRAQIRIFKFKVIIIYLFYYMIHFLNCLHFFFYSNNDDDNIESHYVASIASLDLTL